MEQSYDHEIGYTARQGGVGGSLKTTNPMGDRFILGPPHRHQDSGLMPPGLTGSRPAGSPAEFFQPRGQ